MSATENLLLVIVGSAKFTVGLLSLCAQATSAIPRERIFLWFGLFAAPYGVALILRSITIPQRKGQIELDMVIFGKLIGFAATVPALLLFQETEAENADGQAFGDHALLELLRTYQPLAVESVASALLQEVLAWSGAHQSDDITFVMLDL
jgi:Stage II sporulation protein E (SpoIIE)